MLSRFYLLATIGKCPSLSVIVRPYAWRELSSTAFVFIVIQLCSAMAVDARYAPSTNMADHEQDESDERLVVEQRSAGFLVAPSPFTRALNRIHGNPHFHPSKRHSFGRKHHWDAFFGRR